MEIMNNGVLDSLVNQTTSQQQRGVLVLKKALDAQTQAALSLIQGIPQPPSVSNLPPHLGQTVNTTA